MAPHTPTALQHVNLVVPRGQLHLAEEFYGGVMGFAQDQVPHLQIGTLLWFRIGAGPQQIHVAFQNGDNPGASDIDLPLTSAHACFTVPSPEALLALQQQIYQHMQRGVASSAQGCDKPGEQNSGAQGIEYPTRFFARDFAGNRLEFAVASAMMV